METARELGLPFNGGNPDGGGGVDVRTGLLLLDNTLPPLGVVGRAMAAAAPPPLLLL